MTKSPSLEEVGEVRRWPGMNSTVRLKKKRGSKVLEQLQLISTVKTMYSPQTYHVKNIMMVD